MTKKTLSNLCMNCVHLLRPRPEYLSAKHGFCDLSYSCSMNGVANLQSAIMFRKNNCQGLYFQEPFEAPIIDRIQKTRTK